jgi:hypothetical protein
MDTEKHSVAEDDRDTVLPLAIDEKLKNLPRHQWDGYLWELSCRFVGLEPDAPERPVKPGYGEV